MITCTRRFQFCAGHRVMGHENKCAHLHGHNYVVHISAAASALDTVGRVIDFAALKLRIGRWIDENWDHGFILNAADVDAIQAIQAFIPAEGATQKLFTMTINPTAENIARHLLEEVCPVILAGTGVTAVSVDVEETENCRAKAVLKGWPS